jgi:hypothetical protein
MRHLLCDNDSLPGGCGPGVARAVWGLLGPSQSSSESCWQAARGEVACRSSSRSSSWVVGCVAGVGCWWLLLGGSVSTSALKVGKGWGKVMWVIWVIRSNPQSAVVCQGVGGVPV